MKVRTEKVIAEKADRGWLVMWPSGDVQWFASKRSVLAAVRDRIGDVAMLVTTLEWRS